MVNNNNINIILNNSNNMTGQSEKLEKVKLENNYFLQYIYIKFAGQLSHSTSSRSLYNIYYTNTLSVHSWLID